MRHDDDMGEIPMFVRVGDLLGFKSNYYHRSAHYILDTWRKLFFVRISSRTGLGGMKYVYSLIVSIIR